MSDKTYVIADLHGRFDLLDIALSKIEANAPGTIVFTGDYVDRGPQSREIVERLMRGPIVAGWKWVCLKGNHEDMMRRAYGDPGDVEWWVENGGDQTLASYGWREGEAAKPAGFVPQAHVDWIANLPLCHLDKYRIYVHAGLDHSRSLVGQTAQILMWKRYLPQEVTEYHGRHVVHGHQASPDGPELYSGRSNLDTAAYYTARLVVGVFDDDKAGGPTSLIECVVPEIESPADGAHYSL